jgi:hypothetical protein
MKLVSLRPRAFAIALTALAVAFSAGEASAQTLYGSIVGNVRDTSGASIPAASVTIIHRGTNESRQTQTNSSGGYSFPTVPSGQYELTVTKEGFQTVTDSRVEVTINSVTRADLTLQVGAVTESIQVTAASAVLQTDRSEVRAEVTSTQLVNLPVPPGRNYQYLLMTLPGIRPPTNAHSVPTNPSRALQFNVNGVSSSINNTRLDGASSTTIQLPHVVAYIPTLEAIDTTNVVTNSFDAEQGLAGGAAINLQTKSGTNDMHGSAFEYHTNQHLKARPWILPSSQGKPKLVYNEFGGSLGGPIKRDKLFYFASFEGTFDRENAARLGTVPTPAMKQGDFSASLNPIYDPNTGDPNGSNRQPFANNRIPEARFNPITRRLSELLPNPNVDTTGLNANYYASAAYLFDRKRLDTKVNWNANDKFTTFGRYSIMKYSMNNPGIFGEALGGIGVSAQGGNTGEALGTTHSLTIAGTYVATPTFVLDGNFGYTRMYTQVEQPGLGQNIAREVLGIPGTNGTRRFESGFPRIEINGFNTLGTQDNFMPYYRRDPQFQYVLNGNLTKGRHDIRFGLDFYFQQMNHTQAEVEGGIPAQGAQGGFRFEGAVTALRGAASANQYNHFGAFMLGLPFRRGRNLQVDDEYSTRAQLYSLYLRDRWSVTPKLTLSYGLRWEHFPFPARVGRGVEVFDRSSNTMRICGFGSVPTDCGIEQSKKLFAPRAGFAYRPTDTIVIRAGYGITNDPFSLSRPFRTNYPMLLALIEEGADTFQPIGSISAGIPAIPVPDFGNGVIPVGPTIFATTIDTPFRRGYVQSWNFMLQKQLMWGFTGQAGYVATRSTRQLAWTNANAGQVPGAGLNGRPLFQQFGRRADTRWVEPVGGGRYDALQAQLDRRFSNGFQFGMAYTWSKAIGLTENSDSGVQVNAREFFHLNRRLQNYDRTHNVQITSILELPFGRGRTWATSGPLSVLASGWQLNNIFTMMSGTPFSITADGASLNLPGSTQRADQIAPAVNILGGAGRGQSYFDPLAFLPVTTPRFGNAHYNSMRGPGVFNWDVGVFRSFLVTESLKLEFRAEAFNFTNTPHFANPGGNVSNLQINRATNVINNLNGFSEITNVINLGRDGIDERQFRFGLRLSF